MNTRIIFFVSLGVMWAPLVKIMSGLTARFGVIPYGDTAFAVRVTSALGDLLNITLASLVLALVLAFAIKRVKIWELGVTIAPALGWALYDFASYASLPDNAWITAVFYLLFLVTVPYLLVRMIGNRYAS